jgi:hypothetical protein
MLILRIIILVLVTKQSIELDTNWPYSRPEECISKGKKHHRLPIEKKESYKWVKSYLTDCEA